MKLKSAQVNFPVCLAPMVGLSHFGMRFVLRKYLPKGAVTPWPTEMLNSRRIPKEDLSLTPETRKRGDEPHLVPQILGNEEDMIALSVKRLEEEWGAEGIDINMGCPVRKALKHNYGVSLMGDKNYAAEVVAMTVRNTKLPVSVKIRAGLQKDNDFLLDFVDGLQSAGASWITLHPRVAEQKRRGVADWSQIALIKKQLTIPVVGNGDVQVADDIFAMLEQTGCDSVMVGRALTVRPWMLWQVGKRLGWPDPEIDECLPQNGFEEAKSYGKNLKELLGLMREELPESLGLRKFLFYVKVSHPWLNFGHQLFAGVSKAKSYNEVALFLDSFFKSDTLCLSQFTELRY